jgi:hypothetical protein
MFLGVDVLRWQRLDPVVALAWAVQSIAEPLADAEDNPRLDRRLLGRLRRQWLTRTPVQLDVAYDSIPYPPGIT